MESPALPDRWDTTLRSANLSLLSAPTLIRRSRSVSEGLLYSKGRMKRGVHATRKQTHCQTNFEGCFRPCGRCHSASRRCTFSWDMVNVLRTALSDRTASVFSEPARFERVLLPSAPTVRLMHRALAQLALPRVKPGERVWRGL